MPFVEVSGCDALRDRSEAAPLVLPRWDPDRFSRADSGVSDPDFPVTSLNAPLLNLSELGYRGAMVVSYRDLGGRLVPEDGDEGKIQLYLLDMSKADPEKLKEFGFDGTWTPVEETPEERAKRLEEGLAALAEYEAEYGAFTPEERAWAREILDSLGIGRA